MLEQAGFCPGTVGRYRVHYGRHGESLLRGVVRFTRLERLGGGTEVFFHDVLAMLGFVLARPERFGPAGGKYCGKF